MEHVDSFFLMLNFSGIGYKYMYEVFNDINEMNEHDSLLLGNSILESVLVLKSEDTGLNPGYPTIS